MKNKKAYQKKPNALNAVDAISDKIFEAKEGKIDSIKIKGVEPKYKKGELDYVLYKIQKGKEQSVRILRFIRIKSVSNRIRTEIDIEQTFKGLLNKFGNLDVEFVSMFAKKPKKDLIVSYGVLMEGKESEIDQLIKKSKYYVGSIEMKFRKFRNIEIIPFTYNENWIFTEGLIKFDHLSYTRGIPKPDPSTGAKVGSNPYGNKPVQDAHVTETFLRGASSKIKDGEVSGMPFVMIGVLRRIEPDVVKKMTYSVDNMLKKLKSSRERMASESENFGFPMIFAGGFNEMTGQNVSETMGVSENESMQTGTTSTNTEGSSLATQEGRSTGEQLGESRQVGMNEGLSNQSGRNGGVSHIGSYTENASNTMNEGLSRQVGEQSSTTNQQSFSETQAEQTSHSNAASQSQGEGTGRNYSQATGASESAGTSNNLTGGVSAGDGSSLTRRQIDEHFETGIELYEKYKMRIKNCLSTGMYDFRFYVLTPDEECKTISDELLKGAYIYEEAPLPFRLEKLDDNKRKTMMDYARTFGDPGVLEHRELIPDPSRYSTLVTPSEASALGLPQINDDGYTTSFDAIPEEIQLMGEMKNGAYIGKQLDPAFNLLSDDGFKIAKEKLTHIGIYGTTGQGKTKFLQRFATEVHNEFDMNVLIFDWLENHRSIAGHVKDQKKFRYHDFQNEIFKYNLLVPPTGVPEHVWVPVIAELFCYVTGLGNRSYYIIMDLLEDLLREGKKTGKEPNMRMLVEMVDKEYKAREKSSNGKMDFNEKSTFKSMMDRLKRWTKPGHPIYDSMCGGNYLRVEDLVRGDFLHLLECKALPNDIKPFLINGVAAAIFFHSKFHKKLKKPIYMIFEEAHAVLNAPTGKEPIVPGETIFETINREARNYNLFIGYVIQSPELLPPLIFDNTPLRVVFQIADQEGKNKVVNASGYDPLRMNVELVKWFSRQPRGVCLIRGSVFDRLQDNEFVAVKVDPLPDDELDDAYFKKIYNKNCK